MSNSDAACSYAWTVSLGFSIQHNSARRVAFLAASLRKGNLLSKKTGKIFWIRINTDKLRLSDPRIHVTIVQIKLVVCIHTCTIWCLSSVDSESNIQSWPWHGVESGVQWTWTALATVQLPHLERSGQRSRAMASQISLCTYTQDICPWTIEYCKD